jgi:hypothetical protein
LSLRVGVSKPVGASVAACCARSVILIESGTNNTVIFLSIEDLLVTDESGALLNV